MKLTKYILGAAVAAFGFMATSCVGDLDVEPTDPNTATSPTSKEDLEGLFASVFYDLYTDQGLSLSDGGRGVFTRTHFCLNEITADELFISDQWQDPGYKVLNFNTWTDANEWIYAAFSRENHLAKLASVFISELHQYGGAYFTDDEIKQMEAEARVLRGYAYYQNIDCFGRGPWIDENSVTGATPPTYDRKQLFEAVVADLKAHVDNLLPAAQQVYSRINRETGYMLLAKLYLNAEVYTGTPMWAECAEALKNVVNTGITLAPTYKYLFCGSNEKYVGNGEIIWGLPEKQNYIETWGGTRAIVSSSILPPDSPDSPLAREIFALNYPGDGWAGLRVRPELSKALNGDPRRLFYEGSYQEDIPTLAGVKENSCGYMLTKFRYTTESDYDRTAALAEWDRVHALNEGVPEDSKDRTPYPKPDKVGDASDIALPVFRLADAYLMLAECQMRGVECNGYYYFNEVRKRVGLPAIASPSANDILRERQCELYAEGFRRSDLIRFGKYSGSTYLWSWKGGQYTGQGIDPMYEVFPIPYQYVGTVGQNPGY